ncbi:FMN-binding protein [Falsibacillus pallidus]|uniref:Uncharacterized protein with FMN-binding domain n=1 Tax=Falsibacillus pallidus TaxID=493781 RepID=A0A370GU77_9BACI|nr:FMN-binding protein [Falsibacillus pallidus]RDI45493.1 uncharacterized protein with FMN-binding domain [Falsibacillus pallidus]
MGKMDKKWVVLCSAAVAAVYAGGFYTTEQDAVKMESAHYEFLNKQTNGQVSNPNKEKTNSLNSETINTPKQQYRDGTYTGMGMNRRGEIQVSVTLKKDKIVDVQISDWGMHYSEEDVVNLPDQVVADQSYNVENVSGATYSTEAFKNAVQDALSQAENS